LGVAFFGQYGLAKMVFVGSFFGFFNGGVNSFEHFKTGFQLTLFDHPKLTLKTQICQLFRTVMK